MESKIEIIFPDGNKKNLPKGINGKYIAEGISKSLAKKAVAIKVNGQIKDLADKIYSDSEINLITTHDEDPTTV